MSAVVVLLYACFEACLLDIALVLDHSASVGNSSWQLLTDIMARFVSSLAIGPHATRVGAVCLGKRLNVRTEANTFKHYAVLSAASNEQLYLLYLS